MYIYLIFFSSVNKNASLIRKHLEEKNMENIIYIVGIFFDIEILSIPQQPNTMLSNSHHAFQMIGLFTSLKDCLILKCTINGKILKYRLFFKKSRSN